MPCDIFKSLFEDQSCLKYETFDAQDVLNPVEAPSEAAVNLLVTDLFIPCMINPHIE